MPETPKRTRHEQLQRDMRRSFITEPLLSDITQHRAKRFAIIIALNELYKDGVPEAARFVIDGLKTLGVRSSASSTYVFASLTGEQILTIAEKYQSWADGKITGPVYKVWADQQVERCLTSSIVTVKADAAHRSFKAGGHGIVWAVLDSGIQAKHPHFANSTFTAQEQEWSHNFTDAPGDAFEDRLGHGSHVAGIIAGSWRAAKLKPVVAREFQDDGAEEPQMRVASLSEISGIAPEAKLVSMKILGDDGVGQVSWVLAAIQRIQEINSDGRRIQIHGVNLSVGYDFDARWFGCGQSPICVEVNRLVKSGVSVVVAAGNSGFSGLSSTTSGTTVTGYRSLSIYDPGNAEQAITVGATHRDSPHLYGVSYFSSRGPTGDGRLKPDLVAPGERIVSCAAGSKLANLTASQRKQVLYVEDTGTSMAAPHVSGSIAAFLSVRREFIGQPERVKEIFLANTVDLGRERSFQGRGMLDLMRVLQAV